MRRLALVTIMLLLCSLTQAQVGVGQWRDYLSYDQVNTLAVSSHKVYAAAEMGLMEYDRDDALLSRMNKTTGLSDVGVQTIAYDAKSDYLVIAYTNSNVDILHNDVVYNLSDIKRSDIPGDKGVNSIRINDGKAYLACGFGLVVADLARKEIKETYYLGEHGSYDAVYDVAFDDDHIYAATSNGLLYADKESRFLNIVDNWHRDSSILLGKTVQRFEMADGHIAAAAYSYDPSEITVYLGTELGSLTPITTGDNTSIRLSGGYLTVSTPAAAAVYSLAGVLQQNITDYSWGAMDANDAVVDDKGILWIGHQWGGLIERNLTSGAEHIHHIDGPATDDVYRITPYRSRTFVAPGGKKSTNESLYHYGNMYTLAKNVWQQLDRNGYEGTLSDVLEVAVDPKDTTHQLAVAWGSAVLEIRNNKLINVYDETNTPALQAYTLGDYHSLRVGSVAFDDQGNAWITNSLADAVLVEYTRSGEWKAWNTLDLFTGHGMIRSDQEIDRIIWDSINDYKWMIGKANRLYVLDGQGKMAYVDPNHNSLLETHTVNCIAQDHDGEIWIGTDKGIKVIYDGYKAMNNGGVGELSPVSCSNIIFSQDGIDEYLMAYENISCLAVDGANRKWIGTANNGLYLISANGQEQLQHFTAANSPLFSDKIQCIAVQPRTGEVMIGTNYGLQSYRGTATEATQYNETDIHAFPNPVRPDYDGPVAIKGFSRNALVHITDVAGHVVYSTTADGGQAMWNLRTNSGEKVSSGVYYVMASDLNGENRAVAKILVVR